MSQQPASIEVVAYTFLLTPQARHRLLCRVPGAKVLSCIAYKEISQGLPLLRLEMTCFLPLGGRLVEHKTNRGFVTGEA